MINKGRRDHPSGPCAYPGSGSEQVVLFLALILGLLVLLVLRLLVFLILALVVLLVLVLVLILLILILIHFHFSSQRQWRVFGISYTAYRSLPFLVWRLSAGLFFSGTSMGRKSLDSF